MDASGPLQAFRSLGTPGTGPPVHLAGVEVVLADLRMRQPLATAKGVHSARPIAFARVVGEGEDGSVEGWGECAALADTTFDAEDAESAFAALATSLVPAFVGATAGDDGRVPGPWRLGERLMAHLPSGGASSGPMALAAMEAAVVDLHLRAARRSFADLLGVATMRVPVGGVVALAGADADTDGDTDADGTDVRAVVSAVGELVAAGTSRVRLKIGPGRDTVVVAAVRRAFPDLQLSADANGSYADTGPGAALAMHLRDLDPYGLACIEQPLATGDIDGHARLARALATPVCLDETIASPAAAGAALGARACSVVCLKPSRLGGIGALLDTYRTVAAAGAGAWIGGMFESGFARATLVALAALPGMCMPGDTVPAHHYLAEDVVPPALEGRDTDGVRWTAVHAAPGLGPAPDPGVLDRLVRTRRWVEA